jgi:hypothetical protein
MWVSLAQTGLLQQNWQERCHLLLASLSALMLLRPEGWQ